MEESYAYQLWACSHCEDNEDGIGSIIETRGLLYCETCGRTYESGNGKFISDDDKED